jgi:hypothetical protein
MPDNKDVHTVPNPQGGWSNKVNGVVVSNHKTKEPAVESGRKVAIENGSEHLIHNQNGQVGERNSYGNDPKKSPG